MDKLTVARTAKEARLRQRAVVVWFYGLSGAGKSTLALGLDERLTSAGFFTTLLDGDAMRQGLSRGLGFSDADRAENLRRAAETARLFLQNGVITLGAFISPLRVHRALVREIIGPADLIEVYVSASFATCAQRDTKGLYARAASGSVRQFTGKDSGFEVPGPEESPLAIDSERQSVAACLDQLWARVQPCITL
ncbi:MAG: adenylyl-sulfate kinase [Verrucomicrobia bacterium]|nr:adenylyl-sulfate kinase [Verrucomicrobiota bacterium]